MFGLINNLLDSCGIQSIAWRADSKATAAVAGILSKKPRDESKFYSGNIDFHFQQVIYFSWAFSFQGCLKSRASRVGHGGIAYTMTDHTLSVNQNNFQCRRYATLQKSGRRRQRCRHGRLQINIKSNPTGLFKMCCEKI